MNKAACGWYVSFLTVFSSGIALLAPSPVLCKQTKHKARPLSHANKNSIAEYFKQKTIF